MHFLAESLHLSGRSLDVVVVVYNGSSSVRSCIYIYNIGMIFSLAHSRYYSLMRVPPRVVSLDRLHSIDKAHGDNNPAARRHDELLYMYQ